MNRQNETETTSAPQTKPDPVVWTAVDNIEVLRQVVQSADATIRQLEAEIERLQVIVDRLPKTADGVPISIGSVLWCVDAEESLSDEIKIRAIEQPYPTPPGEPDNDWLLATEDHGEVWRSDCYSNREAAEKAMNEPKDQATGTPSAYHCSTVSLIDFQTTVANLSVAEHALREEPYERLPYLAGTLQVTQSQMECLRQEAMVLKTALFRVREDLIREHSPYVYKMNFGYIEDVIESP
jgi:hypothetical protein